MKKEELLKLKELVNLDIEFIKSKIDLEKTMRKMSIQTLVVGIIALITIIFTIGIIKKPLTATNIVCLSLVTVAVHRQIEDIMSSNINLDKFKNELSHKKDYLKKLNEQLENLA